MKQLDVLDKLHPDLISAFLTTGRADGIPSDVQLFLKQLQWAAEIYEYERNISRASKLLRQPIKVWESNYADKYEDLAKLCAAAGDYKTQGKCYAAALECRRRAAEIAEADRDLGIVFLISPELTPEDLGYSKASLKEIAAKHNRGFYLNLIDNLPIEQVEKKRLLRDADIEEAEYEELNDEE